MFWRLVVVVGRRGRRGIWRHGYWVDSCFEDDGSGCALDVVVLVARWGN